MIHEFLLKTYLGKNRKCCLGRPRKPRKQKQNKKSQNKPQEKADDERRQKPSKPARKCFCTAHALIWAYHEYSGDFMMKLDKLWSSYVDAEMGNLVFSLAIICVAAWTAVDSPN